MTIVCLGSVVLDQVFWIEEWPAEPVKMVARAHEARGGGMAATAAVAIAALGGRSTFWGRVGGDPGGQAVVEQLAAAGVDVADVRFCPGASTAVSAVLITESGERMLVASRGNGFDDDAASLPLDRLGGVRAVLCDVRWPEGTMALFKAARAAGIPSVLDADVSPDPILRELVDLADHVVFSEPALRALTGRRNPAEALADVEQAHARQLGVTLGASGCALWQDGSMTVVPGYDVAVRDTNGAGDTFHGAYALAISEGEPPLRAAAFANAAGALKCALGRGWRGMPDRKAVDALIEGRV
jgi:sulfofructose kinase